MFKARHSGVSNPSLGSSYSVIKNLKATFVMYFTMARTFYSLARV